MIAMPQGSEQAFILLAAMNAADCTTCRTIAFSRCVHACNIGSLASGRELLLSISCLVGVHLFGAAKTESQQVVDTNFGFDIKTSTTAAQSVKMTPLK